jgi:hypothetical protein
VVDVAGAVRRKIAEEIFDYQVLMDALSMFSKPRDAVTRLLSSGVILRIKKGLYCFGETYQRKPLSREYIANLIHGPSCVSLEYALSYHGMIPERVLTVTSVTCKRSMDFDTPLGLFSYRMLSGGRYATGLSLESAAGSSFLIATPEKALIDKVWTDDRIDGKRVSEFEPYLTEDLRIEPETLRGLKRDLVLEICDAYRSAKIRNLTACLERIWRNGDA